MNKIGMSKDELRALAFDLFGVESTSQLNVEEANRLIEELRRKGAPVKKTKYRRRSESRNLRPSGLPTREQLRMIEHLCEILGWRKARREGFNKRMTRGQSWPQTWREASNIIEGLKNILCRDYLERIRGLCNELGYNKNERENEIRAHCREETPNDPWLLAELIGKLEERKRWRNEDRREISGILGQADPVCVS